jgi:lysylphosphatidylglycerol synthetase-like protein (DUF2156 family)
MRIDSSQPGFSDAWHCCGVPVHARSEEARMSVDTDAAASRTALTMLQAHADNPSAFLALNEGTRQFSTPDVPGFIAYRASGRRWIQLGGPFAAPSDQARLLAAFLDSASQHRSRVVAVQLQTADALLYRDNGFCVNQLGASYAVALEGYDLRGKKFVRLRNKIARAHKAGLVVQEVNHPADHDEKLRSIDASWLRAKGWHVKQLEFLVGEVGGAAQQYRRLFLATIDEDPIGYISYSPVYGSRPGWLHDVSRRMPTAPPGVMEAINMYAITRFQQDGAPWLHFGFTPFSGLDPSNEFPGASRIVARFITLLAEHGNAIYPASTQVDYKNKWNPGVVLPEYLAFQGRPSLGDIWRVLRVTKSI